MSTKPHSKKPTPIQNPSVNKDKTESQRAKTGPSPVKTPPISRGKPRTGLKKPSLVKKPTDRPLEQNRLA